jgi:hypothetical protein
VTTCRWSRPSHERSMAEPDHQVGDPCHHPPEADFVSLFLGSVNAVLAGTDAYDAYREFTWRKEHILH